ncbi:MAG: acyl-CoA synthetase [Robiginitomaculum sp.]|nr:MAG: acyl-CoA synthetase [Robiginitomaculum sp.]
MSNLKPTPTKSGLPRRFADFELLGDALDYAATGQTGLNFYSARNGLEEVVPYANLRTRSLDAAQRMLAAGLVAGDRVAIIAETDAEFVVTFFGCVYAGIIPAPLPLPVAFGGKEGYIAHLKRIMQVCGARAVFGPASLVEWIKEAAQTLDLVFAGALASLQPERGAGVELPRAKPEDMSYLQFSSGTTRFPLGVEITHEAFMANARGICRDGLVVQEDDRACSWLPFYHDMGLVGFLLAPLASQLTIDLLPTRDFARRSLGWLKIISDNRATLAYSPSFGYELCARRARTANLDHLDLSCWRAAGIGGDMIRLPVLDRFVECFAKAGFDKNAFVASYGMAEATLAISFAPQGQGLVHDRLDLNALDKESKAKATTIDSGVAQRTFVLCGGPLPGHKIEVRDAAGKALGEGEVGRIFVTGPSLMKEYYGNAGETACVLTSDGWLDTGDLGYFRNGQIVITGRVKDLILVNGRNVWPQDLEWAAESGSEVLRAGDVAAFSVDDGEGEQVILLVQTRISDPERRSSLLSAIEGLVSSEYGLMAKVVSVPPHSLPQTSSGKLSRMKARKMYLEGAFEQARKSSAVHAPGNA